MKQLVHNKKYSMTSSKRFTAIVMLLSVVHCNEPKETVVKTHLKMIFQARKVTGKDRMILFCFITLNM